MSINDPFPGDWYEGADRPSAPSAARIREEQERFVDRQLRSRPLRVYVAGASSERFTVIRPTISRLRAVGCVVTHDWTTCPGFDRPSTEEEKRQWAAEDLQGVRSADLLWYMAPVDKSEGSHGELMAAIVLGKRTVVSGPWWAHGRIFPLLAGERYDDHEVAFMAIAAAAKVSL